MFVQKFESAPCIVIYHDALNVGDFVSLLETEASQSWPYLEWSKSQVAAEHALGEYRTSLEMSMKPIMLETTNDRLVKISNKFKDDIFIPLDACIWDYRRLYDLQLTRDSGWTVLKYSDDAEYHMHHDHAPSNERVLSIVASLGAADEGGELEFPYFNLKIKLDIGDVILFPSNFPYSHIAHPVTRGVKYSLVSWVL